MTLNRFVTLADKKACRLVIGTSRVGCKKLDDGTFMATNFDNKNEQKIIEFAISRGQNFIDTASVYGNAEKIVGAAIKNFRREDLVIATKVGKENKSPEQLLQEIEESCLRLGTQPDIVFLHDRHEGFMEDDLNRKLEVLDKAIDSKLFKTIGISNFKSDELKKTISHSRHGIGVYQSKVNLCTKHSDYVNLKNICESNSIPFMASSALDRGNIEIQVNQKIIDACSRFGITKSQLGILAVLSNNLHPIVQSHNQNHIIENQSIFEMDLTIDDYAFLSKLIH